MALLDARRRASIEQDIMNGVTVVIDRYYYSGCVYSAAKENPSLDLAWARHPDVGLPRPDVCVFLDISSLEAAQRGGYGQERYESSRMQTRVRELFNVLQNASEKDDFIRIDASHSLDHVEKEVAAVVETVFGKVDREQLPLRKVEAW